MLKHWGLDPEPVFRLLSSAEKHTHPFNGPFSGTTQVSRYQKDKTNLDFTEARDSEWQWHQLGKSAPRSRQITMPAPHHSVFLQPDALPAAQPTASKRDEIRSIYIKRSKEIVQWLFSWRLCMAMLSIFCGVRYNWHNSSTILDLHIGTQHDAS